MTELEQKFHDLDIRQTSFETYVKAYIAKTDEAIKQQREDIKRHEERMDKLDAKMDKLGDKIEDIGKEVRNIGRYVNALVITTIIGVAGMAYSMISYLQSLKP